MEHRSPPTYFPPSPTKPYLRVESFDGAPTLLLTRGSVTFAHTYRGANIGSLLQRVQDIVDKSTPKKLETMVTKSPRWVFVGGSQVVAVPHEDEPPPETILDLLEPFAPPPMDPSAMEDLDTFLSNL